jgi:hypothetical protein
MILAPNITNMIGVFTMGFGIMTSVVTNNVSALAALANGLLPLRKVGRAGSGRRSGETIPAQPVSRDLSAAGRVAAPRLVTPEIRRSDHDPHPHDGRRLIGDGISRILVP